MKICSVSNGRRRVIVFGTICLVLLSACATSTGVVNIGKETYSISTGEHGPMASLASVKASAYKEAATFCASKKKAVEALRSQDVRRSFGQFPETEFQFRCADGSAISK